jgi:anti-sigma-K factor RskA
MEGLRHLIKAPVDEADQMENFYWVWQKIEREIQSKDKPPWKESIWRWLDVTPLFRKRVWVPAAAAIVAIFLALAPSLFKETPSSSDLSVVEYVESQSYNVMVYESEKENVTVIWLLEGLETEDLPQS